MPNARYTPLKVNIRVTVPAPARRVIALKMPHAPATARNKLARRAAIESYVQEQLRLLSDLLPFWDWIPTSDLEREEVHAAVVHLRSCGWTDQKIHGWILVQRARLAALRVLSADPLTKENP